MKETISHLTQELNSTQNKLENTILEKNDLHIQIEKLTVENNVLKSLCKLSSVENMPCNSIKKK